MQGGVDFDVEPRSVYVDNYWTITTVWTPLERLSQETVPGPRVDDITSEDDTPSAQLLPHHCGRQFHKPGGQKHFQGAVRIPNCLQMGRKGEGKDPRKVTPFTTVMWLAFGTLNELAYQILWGRWYDLYGREMCFAGRWLRTHRVGEGIVFGRRGHRQLSVARLREGGGVCSSK